MIVNRDPRARGPHTSFADVADAYERGRPGYPDDAVRWLVGEEPRDIVDLGAGTGKLTRSLVALGHRVTAVEPLAEMRVELVRAVPRAMPLEATAEKIPLPDGSVDVVTSAQAFHWFDHGLALPEIARVLRPGGRLALVWNSRDDRDPWTARMSAIIGNETVDDDDLDPLGASGLFEPPEHASFPFEQERDRNGLLDLVLSRSYCAKLAPADREPILRAIGDLYDETASPEGIRIAYVTQCFRARRR
jgi:SAM-dependent methyltransferase